MHLSNHTGAGHESHLAFLDSQVAVLVSLKTFGGHVFNHMEEALIN